MHLHNPPADAQPKACSGACGVRPVHREEPVENLVPVFLRNTDSVIPNRNFGLVSPHAGGQRNFPLNARELDRVVQQVNHNLFNPVPVCPNVAGVRFRFAGNVDLLFIQFRHAPDNGPPQHLVDVEDGHLQFRVVLLQPAHSQQVIDQPAQPFRFVRNQAQVFRMLLLRNHPVRHAFGKSADAGNRAAQFMAHVGNKFSTPFLHVFQLLRHGVEGTAHLLELFAALLFVKPGLEVSFRDAPRRLRHFPERFQHRPHGQENRDPGKNQYPQCQQADLQQNPVQPGFDLLGPCLNENSAYRASVPNKGNPHRKGRPARLVGPHPDVLSLKHFPQRFRNVFSGQGFNKSRIFAVGRPDVVHHVAPPIHHGDISAEFPVHLVRLGVQVFPNRGVPPEAEVAQRDFPGVARNSDVQIRRQIGNVLRFRAQVVQPRINLLIAQRNPPDAGKTDRGDQNRRHHHGHNPCKHKKPQTSKA